MADLFLIFVIVVAFVILTIIGLYLVVKYQHPDDKNDAYFPKLVVLFGFVLAGATVLLLPLDVANNEGFAGCDGWSTAFCGGLNMALFWEIFYWLITVWLFVLIPFSMFYYEADDGMLMVGTSVGAKPNSRICEAIKYEITSIPVVEISGPSFANGATYTVTENSGGTFGKSQLADMGSADKSVLQLNKVAAELGHVALSVNASTFYAGLMAWLGWFFFALFGGIGLAALPLDLILAWLDRPRHMDPLEFAEAQTSLRDRVNELVAVGELLKYEREEREQQNGGKRGGFFDREARKQAAEEKQTFLQFKQAVYLLEEDAEDFANCTENYNSYNPLIPIGSLIAELVQYARSIKCCNLFVLPTDSCREGVLQIRTAAFQDYARYTTINQVFNVQLYYLQFFGWWWRNKVFEFIFLAVVLLTCFYLGLKPRDTSASNSLALRDRLKRRA
eukprot:scaffold7921_cov68-Cyclotella_meneghiniana.AAC.8